MGWLIALGLVWVALAVVVARAAQRRERNPALYFVASLGLSPIIALILLAVFRGGSVGRTGA